MKTVVLALGGLTAAWMAAPMVSMAVCGTIDRRTLAACRRPAVEVSGSMLVIPSPRRGSPVERIPA